MFRGRTVVQIPYTLTDAGLTRLELELRSQGCADWGLCYPPQRWQGDRSHCRRRRHRQQAANRRPGAIARRPSGHRWPGRTRISEAEEAFVVCHAGGCYTIRAVRWTIADGYYLYRDKFAVAADSALAQLGARRELPRPARRNYDEFFGDTEVYYGSPRCACRSRAAGRPTDIELALATYQGCAEDGICYPPMTRDLQLYLPAVDAVDVGDTTEQSLAKVPLSEQDRLAKLIAEGNLLLVLATFLWLGLLLAFTPCVLPMVPILSGIIVGQGENTTTR